MDFITWNKLNQACKPPQVPNKFCPWNRLCGLEIQRLQHVGNRRGKDLVQNNRIDPIQPAEQAVAESLTRSLRVQQPDFLFNQPMNQPGFDYLARNRYFNC